MTPGRPNAAFPGPCGAPCEISNLHGLGDILGPGGPVKPFNVAVECGTNSAIQTILLAAAVLLLLVLSHSAARLVDSVERISTAWVAVAAENAAVRNSLERGHLSENASAANPREASGGDF